MSSDTTTRYLAELRRLHAPVAAELEPIAHRCTWERPAGGHGYPGRCVRAGGHEGDHMTPMDLPHDVIGIDTVFLPSPTAVAFEASYVARELADAALNAHAHECPRCRLRDGFDCEEYDGLREQARTARAAQLAAASASLAAWGARR